MSNSALPNGASFHPNRRPIRGLLTYVDAPSNKAAIGAGNHRVALTRRAALEAIHTLVGMGINYDPDHSGHNPQRKVGIVTHAEVLEKWIEISGYVFAWDFPEVMVALLTREAELGMSFETTACKIKNKRAKVWSITSCTFTGAAILRSDKTAYPGTWVRLAF